MSTNIANKENLWNAELEESLEAGAETHQIEGDTQSSLLAEKTSSEEPLPSTSGVKRLQQAPLGAPKAKKRKMETNLETTIASTFKQLETLMKEEKENDTESSLFGKWVGVRLSKIKSKKARIAAQKEICSLLETFISSDED